MVSITFSNGYTLRCAAKHILRRDNKDIYATDVSVGDRLGHRDGVLTVMSVFNAGVDTCYDISVPSPHLYYDSAGLVHHNTIITAILSHKVEPYGRSIVIVPTKDLVTQTEEDYINFGLDVGVFYGDRKDYGKKHTICTWQSIESLAKKTKAGVELDIDITKFFEDVVCVVADECHRAKGDVLRKILSGPLANAPIRWGLTGTMPELEFEQVGVISCVGPVLNRVETTHLQEQGILAKLHVNIWQLQDMGTNAFSTYQTELKWLTTSPPRLNFLANKFTELAETGNTLILVDRIETGTTLQSLIPDSIFISGQMKSEDRKAEYKEVQQVNGKVIIATYGVASTGININRIFNLVLFEAGKSFVRVIQSIGRGIRVAEDKDFVNVYDVCSISKYSKQHSTRRKKFYNEYKYPYTVTKLNY
jgi:superfamily II DNA or RNA helicase